MPRVTRASGLTIAAPDSYRVDDTPSAGPARTTRGIGRRGRVTGPVPMPAAGSDTSGTDALLAALEAQDFDLVDRVDLTPTLEPTARDGIRRSAAPPVPLRQEAQVDLTVGAGEEAVLLVEQGGVYAWTLPSSTEAAPAEARRTRSARAPGKVLRFRIDIHATRESGGPVRRGLLSTLVYDRVTVYALKFAASAVVSGGVRFLERHVRRGLVLMQGLDPSAWRLTAPGTIALPADRPARLLLFFHGTFSSTIGSFGALCGTPWGQAFLEAAAEQYDAMLGFDHATLSDDPMANATELLNALESLNAPVPPRVDAIAFSRGGLVFRTLVEHLLPQAPDTCRVERGVFVGCTNAGTHLADAENWRTLIDLYTNLAVGAFRLLTLLPQAAASALVLQELVSGLGACVKHLASSAAADVPGLSAMQPDGPFVRAINALQPGQPDPGSIAYFAVTSSFRPRIEGGTHEPRELPLRLVMAIADGLVDRVMGEANDLVVHTASMTAIDEALGPYVRDTFAFGETCDVYHTSYFARPEVTNALARWLELPAPTRAAALPPIPGPRELAVPASVDTDIVVADALAPAGHAAALIEAESPSFVVVRRPHGGELFHYAFTPEEVLPRAEASPGAPLEDVLGLHEWQRSPESPVDHVTAMTIAAGAGPVSTTRIIAMQDDTPVGVVPEPGAAQPAGIAEVARMAAAPATTAERVAARRAMPTFASRGETAMSPGGGGAAAPSLTPRPAPAVRRGGVRRGLHRSEPPAGSAPEPAAAPAAPPAPSPASVAAPERVECHVLAEMDPEVLLNHTTTIEVTISREMLAPLAGRMSAAGGALVDAAQPLLVQAIAKSNFVLADPAQDRVTVQPPEAGAPLSVYFDVKAAHPGPGEIWIVVRQHQMGVARLTLQPTVVERASAGRARRVVAEADAVAAPPLAEPLNQLSIVEQTIGETVQYLFELELPGANVFELRSSAPLQVKREDYVRTLYKEIEDRYVSTYDRANKAADVAAFTAELQAYGATLFDRLFPREIQELLWAHRDALTSVRVVSTEPFIPWEIVHMREPGKPLDPAAPPRFLGQMGLVRWLHNVNGLPPPALQVRAGRARYVIPDYPHPDWQLPTTVNERLYVEQAFGATPIEPQPNPLRAALAQPGTFDLLHIACHGEADSDAIAHARIVLEGRVEGPDFVPTHLNASTVETFARLRGSDGVQPIVFLNACQAGRAGYQLTGIGGFAQAFLKAGAGAFVGTLWSVEDKPAFFFGRAFYETLRAGGSISEAAIKAREAARRDDATWLAYVVYAHPHARMGKG
jgi:hypothetical protein